MKGNYCIFICNFTTFTPHLLPSLKVGLQLLIHTNTHTLSHPPHPHTPHPHTRHLYFLLHTIQPLNGYYSLGIQAMLKKIKRINMMLLNLEPSTWLLQI